MTPTHEVIENAHRARCRASLATCLGTCVLVALSWVAFGMRAPGVDHWLTRGAVAWWFAGIAVQLRLGRRGSRACDIGMVRSKARVRAYLAAMGQTPAEIEVALREMERRIARGR